MKIGPFTLSKTKLQLNTPPDIEDWEKHAETIFTMLRAAPWWVGDMVLYGEANFGDDFYQCVPEGTSTAQIERITRVARAYPPAERFAELSYTHHQIAMRLSPQLRRSILSQAAQHKWDTKFLEKRIRELSADTIVDPSLMEGDTAG